MAPLGALTLAAYAVWVYGFGVQVEAMADDLGWSTGRLGLAFGGAQLISGIAAFLVGAGLDRRRPAAVVAVTGVVGSALLGGAAAVEVPIAFALLYAAGGGLVGGAGFYSATMGVIARRLPEARPSINSLTIVGAFCAPVFIPIIRALTIRYGWRPTLGGMSALTAAAFVLTWFRIRAFEAPSIAPSGGLLRGIPAALRGTTAAGRALLVASTLLGFGVGVAIAFQIPTMTAAGMAAGTAAALASFRALMQLGGRLPLTPLVLRFGSRRTLVGAYVVGAAGFVALAVADRWWVGAVFAVLAGAGYGAVSPLHGMVGAEEFEGSSMGALLGVQALVSAVGSALGPAVAGLLRDRTGSFVPGTLASAVVVLVGAVVLGTAPPSRRT